MANLTFTYGTMMSGKTTLLLQEAHNFKLNDFKAYLLTAAGDTRSGAGKIKSRIGIESDAETYSPGEDLYKKLFSEFMADPMTCIMVDEAQWLSKSQVWQLSDIVDNLGIPVKAYGLRTDFKGDLFEGSAALLAIADELKEVTGICKSGEKANMVARLDADGNILTKGPQVLVGGDDTYEPMSRSAWKRAIRESSSRPLQKHTSTVYLDGSQHLN